MKPTKRSVTQEDVARRAGVSTAVVSYVLNDGTRPVAPETRERVLKAIRETEYEANYHAAALAGGQTRTAGLVVPDITNAFFGELARALQDQLRPTGHTLLLGDSIENPDEEIKVIRTLERRGVDALFIIGASDSLDRELATSRTTKMVFLDRSPKPSDIASVTIDNREAARRATHHLQQHGRQRVAAIAGPVNLKTARDRLEGYNDALVAAGNSRTRNSTAAPFTRAGGYVAATKLLQSDRVRTHFSFRARNRPRGHTPPCRPWASRFHRISQFSLLTEPSTPPTLAGTIHDHATCLRNHRERYYSMGTQPGW